MRAAIATAAGGASASARHLSANRVESLLDESHEATDRVDSVLASFEAGAARQMKARCGQSARTRPEHVAQQGT